MSRKDLVFAFMDSDAIDNGVKFIGIEVAAVGIGLGLWQSWWLGCIAFFVLLAMMFIKKTAIPLAVIFTGCYGFGAWAIGHYWIGSTGAAVVLALIAVALSTGLHAWGFAFMHEDDDEADESNGKKKKSKPAAPAEGQAKSS